MNDIMTKYCHKQLGNHKCFPIFKFAPIVNHVDFIDLVGRQDKLENSLRIFKT